MVTNGNKENPFKFVCSNCDYNTCKKSQYDRHLLTDKHNMVINGNKKVPKVPKQEYYCLCGKVYKYIQGLSRHKKVCPLKQNENKLIEPSDSDNYKDIVFKLITENEEFKNVMFKENQELRKQLIEQQKQMTELFPYIGNNNTTNNNVNNIKQKFNINVFLNEKCKDAISIDQFIETIEVSMKNLLTTKEKGLSEGLSSIIIDNMNKLSLYERPMHCTDKKRETMYIKNQVWVKDEKQEQIDNLLKKVENKQMKNIKIWMDDNPTFMENEKLQEEYIKLVKNSTSSINDCKDKAIKNVCEKVYLDKDND